MRKPGRSSCLARSSIVHFTLMSFEVTVLVNGFAVKRITAVILVSVKLPVGSPPLELEVCVPPDGADELELDDPPLETYAVT